MGRADDLRAKSLALYFILLFGIIVVPGMEDRIAWSLYLVQV